jgi:integral membrane protein (TIGR01906 family)
MNRLEKIGFTLFCIMFAVLILLVPYKILFFNEPYYHSQFQKTGVYLNIGEDKANAALNDVFLFLKNKQESISGFNEDEISHMKDVRNLLSKLNAIFCAFLGLSIFFLLLWALYYNKKEKYRCLFSSFFYSGIFCIILITTAGLLLVIDFNFAFTLFHKIFFPMGNYTFDPSVSLLKQLFPNKFFYNFTILCTIISLIISIILILLFFVYNRWSIFVKNRK